MEENVELKTFTTFKLGGQARYFFRVKNETEAREALSFARGNMLPFFVLGGGSNLLVSDKGFSGVVIKNEIKGTEWTENILKFRDLDILKSQNINISKSQNVVLAVVGAGENWDNFVSECVKRGLYGLENLSGIPGTVGAAPVQNIGAYGMEAKDSVVSVEALQAESGKVRVFANTDCRFGYRDSFFKTAEGKSYIIISVTFCLKKSADLNLGYKDLKSYFGILPLEKGVPEGGGISKSSVSQTQPPSFKKGGIVNPTLSDVRTAVLEIRSKKFPDLKTTGTAGSFFKNPIIPQAQFDELKKRFPDLPGFPIKTTNYQLATVKLPLAWILDNILHLKGFMNGAIGLHDAQPLVIIHKGGGTTEDVAHLALEVAEKIKAATGINILWEVEYLA